MDGRTVRTGRRTVPVQLISNKKKKKKKKSGSEHKTATIELVLVTKQVLFILQYSIETGGCY